MLRNWWQRSDQRHEVVTKLDSLPSGLPAFIDDDEPIARFLTQSNHFSRQKKIVKPAALMPDKGEKSVYRHGKEPRDQLWMLAKDNLRTGQVVHGAAILAARDVRAEKLNVIPKEPPLRHANIIGWPTDSDPEEEKAKHKELALVLTGYACLVLTEDS